MNFGFTLDVGALYASNGTSYIMWYYVYLQTLLVRWMLVVYDYIDGYDNLHCLYGILFLFLDSQAMVSMLWSNLMGSYVFL